MPLLDHFHPPLSRRRHWEGLHAAWANAICRHLNADLLPPRFFAEAQVHAGGRSEVDVATFEEELGLAVEGGIGVAVWAPPRPSRVATLDFGEADVFEVRVSTDEDGPRLVAAIELVRPANKDRPGHRRMFAAKCAGYLQESVGLMLVDVVTERSASLHEELLGLLGVSRDAGTPADLYAGTYRIAPEADSARLESWFETLAVGDPLPTLPLWIGRDLALPLDLERTYGAACASLRIG